MATKSYSNIDKPVMLVELVSDAGSGSSRDTTSVLAGTFKRAAAVGATAGDALWVQGVTTAGTITVTLANGGSLTANVALGSTLLPFGATAAALGTAVGGTFQSLFFV